MKREREVQATYDGEKMGPRYTLDTRVGGRFVSHERLVDPFVHHAVTIGLLDLLRGLLRRRLEVVVHLTAPADLCEDVMELNADYLGDIGSKRRLRWEKELNAKLAAAVPHEGGEA